jgi:cation diffusion facilitator CzcD-associated flavoprotein CzcO
MLQKSRNCPKNEAGGKVLETPNRPRHRSTCTRGDHMPFEHEYGDSTPKSNPEQNETWQSLGDLARKLAEKVGGAN